MSNKVTYKRDYHLAPIGSVWIDSPNSPKTNATLYKLIKIDNEYAIVALNGIADGKIVRRDEDPNKVLDNLYRFTGKVNIEIDS